MTKLSRILVPVVLLHLISGRPFTAECDKLNSKFELKGQLGKVFEYLCSDLCHRLSSNQTRPVCTGDDGKVNDTCSDWLNCMEGPAHNDDAAISGIPAGSVVGIVVGGLALFILIFVVVGMWVLYDKYINPKSAIPEDRVQGDQTDNDNDIAQDRANDPTIHVNDPLIGSQPTDGDSNEGNVVTHFIRPASFIETILIRVNNHNWLW